MSDPVPVNDLVTAYRNLRGAIAEEEEAHEIKLKSLKDELEIISTELLTFCNEQNLDSVKTPAGTVSRRVQTRYWSTDWEEMYRFVMEHNVPFLLEKRLHNTNVKQYLEENPEAFPAGLQIDNKYVIQVRKPTSK
jgi:hypothetical protein